MTQIFEADGRLIPVTVIEAGPCVVIQNKTEEKDGYNAVQLGFGEVKEKHTTKPMKGHFDKAGVTPVKFVKELRLSAPSEFAVGDKISCDILLPANWLMQPVFPAVKALQVLLNATISLVVL